MANKINEIIDVINSGATGDYDAIVERLDTIDSEIDVSSEFPNQKINNVVLNNADNIDALYQITETEIGKVFNYVENWVVETDESELFDTVDGEKYFKHDTYVYFNHLRSSIRGYFVKGFPKKGVRISSTFVESLAPENLGFVTHDMFVTNDDRFCVKEYALAFDFNETPIKSQDDMETWYPQYATSYDDTGDYGKIVMLVRNIALTESVKKMQRI